LFRLTEDAEPSIGQRQVGKNEMVYSFMPLFELPCLCVELQLGPQAPVVLLHRRRAGVQARLEARGVLRGYMRHSGLVLLAQLVTQLLLRHDVLLCLCPRMDGIGVFCIRDAYGASRPRPLVSGCPPDRFAD